VVVRVKLDEWTRLPRLGTDAFKELMKAGARYEGGRGFLIPRGADLQRIRRAISGALGGAPVEFEFRCMLCGRETSCEDCEYHDVCSIDETSALCICSSCARSASFEAYAEAWRRSVAGDLGALRTQDPGHGGSPGLESSSRVRRSALQGINSFRGAGAISQRGRHDKGRQGGVAR